MTPLTRGPYVWLNVPPLPVMGSIKSRESDFISVVGVNNQGQATI